MSTRKRKKTRLEQQAAMGYEKCPPRCGNCRNLQSAATLAGNVYRRPHCNIGDFPVTTESICDRWTGSNGDTIA